MLLGQQGKRAVSRTVPEILGWLASMASGFSWHAHSDVNTEHAHHMNKHECVVVGQFLLCYGLHHYYIMADAVTMMLYTNVVVSN